MLAVITGDGPAQSGDYGPWTLRPRSPRSWLWFSHLLALLPALLLLLAVSTPGLMFFAALAALAGLAAAAVGWVVWVIVSLIRRRWSWWIPVAPLGACLLVGLMAAEVPLQARWAVSRHAFADQVLTLPQAPGADEDWVELDIPGRVGLYHVTEAYRVPGGVVFYEANGSLFDNAGFAYLPDGPSDALANGYFERPQFQHLDGPWYMWTASW